MKTNTTTQCSECGGIEHEVWCAIVPAPEAHAPVPEARWVAVLAPARRLRFTMAAGATADQALRFAVRCFAADGDVIAVEQEG